MLENTSIVDIVKAINAEAVQSHNIPENFLCVVENKDGSESVWLKEPVTGKKSKMAFNYTVKGRKNARYISFTIKNKIIPFIEIPEEAEKKNIASDKDNTYFIFDSWNDSTLNFIRKVIFYFIENFEPSDKFGCCGKYKECSQEKKCLHDNKFYAKACWYRKKLEAGEIFF
ncbi:MAG: hypothetical protein IJX77_07885 [Ruminococcus sp.]|nr:hypothetical protein [Ruminococcus sp.]